MAASTTSRAATRPKGSLRHLLARSISTRLPLPGSSLVMSGRDGRRIVTGRTGSFFQVMEDSPRTTDGIPRALAMASLVTRDSRALRGTRTIRAGRRGSLAQGVREAMRRAGISRAEGCPFRYRSSARSLDHFPANRRSTSAARATCGQTGGDTLKSIGLLPRRKSALGTALALGEPDGWAIS